jgi:hypothetical protein
LRQVSILGNPEFNGFDLLESVVLQNRPCSRLPSTLIDFSDKERMLVILASRIIFLQQLGDQVFAVFLSVSNAKRYIHLGGPINRAYSWWLQLSLQRLVSKR